MDAQELARVLYGAYAHRRPLDIEPCLGVLQSFDEAFAVQDAFLGLTGEAAGGYKIAATNKGMQAVFGIDEPLLGPFAASRVLKSGVELRRDLMNEPLIEFELMMIPKEDLGPGLTEEELLQKVELCCGIEIPDSRFRNWFPGLHKFLFVADLAVGGCMVVGSRRVDGAALTAESLKDIRCELFRDGEPAGTGVSSSVLGNPIVAFAWLVEALGRRGRKLMKGQVVTTGAFATPPALQKGAYAARFTGPVADEVCLTVV